MTSTTLSPSPAPPPTDATIPMSAVPLRPTRSRPTPLTAASIALAVGMGLLGVVPLVAVGIGAIGEGSGILDALAREDVPGLVRNTLIVVAVSTVFALVIGAVLAWVNERTDAGMGLVTEAMPLLPFMLPRSPDRSAGCCSWRPRPAS
ncbi:hypothetical protein [Microbacterium sp. JZ31]|uniref:hypothetical protein n=1 Tax=Microbacterium sp. JZ31 TaxID=1906274 RepID=UPI00193379A2|nr:hypothetical protein [Microbacterium sp. JZ31]